MTNTITDVASIVAVDAELGALLTTLGDSEGKTANAAKAVAVKCIALGYTVEMMETPAANCPVPLSFRKGLAEYLLAGHAKSYQQYAFMSDDAIREVLGLAKKQRDARFFDAQDWRDAANAIVRSALGRVRTWLKKYYVDGTVDENLRPNGNGASKEGSTRHGALEATKQSVARFADGLEKRLDEKKVEALNLPNDLRDEYEAALAGVISAIGAFEAVIAKCETHHADLVSKAPKAFGEAKNAALDIAV